MIDYSAEGVNSAGESLVSNASTLYNLFDELTDITNRINNNVTGFAEAEELVASLNKINNTKEQIRESIESFGNYLTQTVAPGYDAFMNALGAIAGNGQTSGGAGAGVSTMQTK